MSGSAGTIASIAKALSAISPASIAVISRVPGRFAPSWKADSNMHSGEAVPLTNEYASMHDAIVEMSAKRLGIIGVVDASGNLVGAITDGDLRRHIEQGLDHSAAEFMTRDPKTVASDALIDDALTLFEEHKITALFVVEDKRPVGVLHIHDCPPTR